MVPSQQPRKPIGIVTRPGNVSEDGEPAESGPGHTGGLSTIITTLATIPHTTPVSAPRVLNRRQNSASTSGGKLALAANTNAMLTITVTLMPEPTAIAASIVTTPTATEATRPARRSDSSSARCITLAHRSWAIALAEASTSPATTARIVANAAAENSASATSPPVVPCPPPSAAANNGAARLPPLPTASAEPLPSTARAPNPITVTITVNDAMMPLVYITDVRAARAP